MNTAKGRLWNILLVTYGVYSARRYYGGACGYYPYRPCY